MNIRLLDILVCPFDKVSSLELFRFKPRADNFTVEDKIDKSPSHNDSNNESSRKNIDGNVTNSQDSVSPTTTSAEIIEEGILLCKTCMRFYPITEEIPIILPDELRDKKKDIEFLEKWSTSVPEELLKNLKPWTLSKFHPIK